MPSTIDVLIASSGGSTGGSGGGSGFFLVLALMVAAFYLLVIRPQRRRQKALATQVGKLGIGDEVYTRGGLLGRIVDLDEGSDVAAVELAPGLVVRALRQTLAARPAEQAPGDDLIGDDLGPEDVS